MHSTALASESLARLAAVASEHTSPRPAFRIHYSTASRVLWLWSASTNIIKNKCMYYNLACFYKFSNSSSLTSDSDSASHYTLCAAPRPSAAALRSARSRSRVRGEGPYPTPHTLSLAHSHTQTDTLLFQRHFLPGE